MRNTCKHSNVVMLSEQHDVRWWWCPDCGVTRMDKGRDRRLEWAHNGSEYVYNWVKGKWVSPKQAKL